MMTQASAVHRSGEMTGAQRRRWVWDAEDFDGRLREAFAHDAALGDDARPEDILVLKVVEDVCLALERSTEWVLAVFLLRLHGAFVERFGDAPRDLEGGRLEVLLTRGAAWLFYTCYQTVRLEIAVTKESASRAWLN